MDAPSHSQLDDAGRLLRDWASGRLDGPLHDEEFNAAVRLVTLYRQSFTDPSRATEALIATFLTEVAPDAKLTGRPKRTGAIIGKLVRHRSMRLTQMADIAGLRVRFSQDAPEVRHLCQRMETQWPTAKLIDYVARPKPTGYRALHVLVEMDGRVVEVQLRTANQNRWADEVELAADRLDIALKDGEGPDDLVRYFERAAYKLAIEDQGGALDEAFKRDFEDLRQKIRGYFR